MMGARFALFLRPGGGHERRLLRGDQRKGLIEPLPTQPELVLAGVNRETEALLRGLAPHAAPSLLQTGAAIGALVARSGTLLQGNGGIRGVADPGAFGLLDSPFAQAGSHATLAADEVGAVGAGAGLEGQVAPVGRVGPPAGGALVLEPGRARSG